MGESLVLSMLRQSVMIFLSVWLCFSVDINQLSVINYQLSAICEKLGNYTTKESEIDTPRMHVEIIE